jgi:heterodisulfide reductase subunit C
MDPKDTTLEAEFDKNFQKLLLPIKDKLNKCFECGTCSASCVVNKFVPLFNPRCILAYCRLGLKSVLTMKELWFCANCLLCTERCPQNVKLADIITFLQKLAIKEGYFPKSVGKTIEILSGKGLTTELTEFQEWEREELGLKKLIPIKRKDLEIIIDRTALKW